MSEIQDEYREYKKLCRVEDDPGVSGLAQLRRNAIERVTELERALAERDEAIRKLRDPVFVHVAMLRGDIAVPPLAEMLHIYGATFSSVEAANIELAKARETIRDIEHQNRNYALIIGALGKRAEAADAEICRKAIDEIEQLRQRIAALEAERAERV